MTAAARTAPALTRPQPLTSSVLAVLGGAAVLALAGDLLFKDAEAGLNLFVWVAGLAAWSTFLARGHTRVRPAPDAWQLPAVFFAAMFALTSSEGLLFLDLVALLLVLGLPLLRARGLSLRTATITAYAVATFRAGLHAFLGWLPLLALDVPWRELSGRVGVRRAGPIAAGLLLAVPVVAVFAALFASADPVFQGAIDALLVIELEPLIPHVIITALCGAIAAGYLRGRLWGERPGAAPVLTSPAGAPFATVGIATGAMVLVFLLYVAVQARAMFGGAEYVRATAGLTLAEYARHGFFESVAACGLSLPVLLGADWLLGTKDPRAATSFRALCLLQAALIGVVLASALLRLALYVSAFGLTPDRIFGVAALAWLTITTALFTVTVARGRRERFAFGAVVGGFGVLAALNFVNPDALVARVNIGRAEAGRLDYEQLARLSLDAAPTISARLSAMRDDHACYVLTELAKRAAAHRVDDWREFNLSAYRAQRAIARARNERAATCAAALVTTR